MIHKFKIAVVGIGGVGGYIGGKLAAHYKNSNEVSVFFVARGENEKAIKENGLKLISGGIEIIAYPSGIGSSAREAGSFDLIICCVKSYQLADSMRSLQHCVGDNSILLPLLNGVNASESIQKIFPAAMVLEGCIYLGSRLTAPGVVEQYGNIQQLYFGSNECPHDKLKVIESLLRSAGIDATCKEDIRDICWEKFFFISTIATLTSYLDVTIGQVLANREFKEQLLCLMNEFKSIAAVKGIALPEDIIYITLDKLASLPFNATTSMHTDFKKGNQTELESLTGYVISLAEELNIQAPVYNEMFLALKGKKPV